MAAGGDEELRALALRARSAGQILAAASHEQRCAALTAIKEGLQARREEIEAANREDVASASVSDVAPALLKRLGMTKGKFEALFDGIESLKGQEDPVRRTTMVRELDEGLLLHRMTWPIGVLCIIYEARPEAAVQIATLCIKSGNALILKGGSEASGTNAAIGAVLRAGLGAAGLPVDAIQLVSTRSEIAGLLALDDLIDVIIPRGSKELIRSIKARTRIPVMGHADGICAGYIHSDADPDTAVRVLVDAKTDYPAACNSVETILIHRDALDSCLPPLVQRLALANVKLRADETCKFRARRALSHAARLQVTSATEGDFDTEFLGLQVAMKVVDSLPEAVDHINTHGSGHTDVIITRSKRAAREFTAAVDSAGVYVNASTRFADGYRYGFGAEVGISTNRIHARGPVGVEGLMIYKYSLVSNGEDLLEDDAAAAAAAAAQAAAAAAGGGDGEAQVRDAAAVALPAPQRPAHIASEYGVPGSGKPRTFTHRDLPLTTPSLLQ